MSPPNTPRCAVLQLYYCLCSDAGDEFSDEATSTTSSSDTPTSTPSSDSPSAAEAAAASIKASKAEQHKQVGAAPHGLYQLLCTVLNAIVAHSASAVMSVIQCFALVHCSG
jgi:hypothetical protein